MSATRPPPPPPAGLAARPDALGARRPGTAAARGFTLIELIFAFAILAIAMTGLMESQAKSMDKGMRTLELRDLRVMADTVFRRIVYEQSKWDDGQRGDAAEWYADFAQIPPGPLRERWKMYRLELRKKKGLVAGTDPSGSLGALFEDTDASGRTTSSGTSGSSGSSGTSGTPGSGTGSSTDAAGVDVTGEPAYVIELNVYLLDREEPELTLRSIVPLSEDERKQATSK